MICNKCNKEIQYVRVHRFTYDGHDTWSTHPILGGDEGYCNFIDIDKGATMFEFDDSFEEFTTCIECPKCKQYPFKGSVTIEERAHVIFGISEEDDFV